MKRLLSLFLVCAIAFSVLSVGFTTVSAETKKEFVIDGVLDQWYRDDAWAQENDCYFYYTQ